MAKRDVTYTDGNYSNSGYSFEEYNKDGKYLSGIFAYVSNKNRYEIDIYEGRYSDSPNTKIFDNANEAVEYFNKKVKPEENISTSEINKYVNIWNERNGRASSTRGIGSTSEAGTK